ncbi:MAG: hypothetical protein ACE5GN_01595 [Waddliaceae bacterium]
MIDQKKWLNEELHKTQNRPHDTKMIWKVLPLLISMLFFAIYSHASLQCPTCGTELEVVPVEAGKAASWRCKKCGDFNYSEDPDWKGDYYCGRCGTRKGDE